MIRLNNFLNNQLLVNVGTLKVYELYTELCFVLHISFFAAYFLMIGARCCKFFVVYWRCFTWCNYVVISM